MFDQWNIRFIDRFSDPQFLFSASVNSNNAQSAVLWGIRSNFSHLGILSFNNLAISQPGKIEFKLFVSEINSNKAENSSKVNGMKKFIFKIKSLYKKWFDKNYHLTTPSGVSDWKIVMKFFVLFQSVKRCKYFSWT